MMPSILRGNTQASIDSRQFIVPEYAAYGSGDGSFRLAEDPKQALAGAAALCARFNALSSPMLSEISEEQYRTAMTGYESVQIFFRYGMPAAEFLEQFGAGKVSGADGIGDFTCFAFSQTVLS